MATVTTSTASVNAEVTYVCSVCGTENTQQVTIEASANNSAKAEARMQNILTELVCDDPSQRYIHANLDCKCRKCHYSEPWANLNFYKLDTLIRMFILIGGLILLAGLANPYSSGGMSVFAVICLLAAAGIFIFKKAMAASSAKKIGALPTESLPTVRLLRNAAPTRDDIMARINDKMNNG